MPKEQCAGCRLVLPTTGAVAVRPGVRASSECLELIGEVIAYGMKHQEVLGIWHQTCVDAYLLQHVDPAAKPISVCFALNGLYLVIERGWSGIAAREAHRYLAEGVPREEWVRFDPPEDVGALTALEPALASTSAEQAHAVERWGATVWAAWSHTHERVSEMTDRQLAGWRPMSRSPRGKSTRR